MNVSVHVATDEQIEKILKKHLKRVYHCSYSHDSEDGIGFVWCSSSPLNCFFIWQLQLFGVYL